MTGRGIRRHRGSLGREFRHAHARAARSSRILLEGSPDRIRLEKAKVALRLAQQNVAP